MLRYQYGTYSKEKLHTTYISTKQEGGREGKEGRSMIEKAGSWKDTSVSCPASKAQVFTNESEQTGR